MSQQNQPILIAQNTSNSGFSLPTGNAPSVNKTTEPAATTATTQAAPTGSAPALVIETGSGGNKGLLIGLGLLLVVMVVAFFLRGAWANNLVAKKVSPHAANASGWWLFVLLTSVLGGSLFGLVNPGFFTIIYIGILAVLSLIALIMMILSSSKR